jgi:hypothetical protein
LGGEKETQGVEREIFGSVWEQYWDIWTGAPNHK